MDEKYLKEVIASLIEECLPEGVNYSPAGYLSKTNRPTGVQSWNPDAQAQFAADYGEEHVNKGLLAQSAKNNTDAAKERAAYAAHLKANRAADWKKEDEIAGQQPTKVAQPQNPATVSQPSQPSQPDQTGEPRPDVNQILKVLNSKQ